MKTPKATARTVTGLHPDAWYSLDDAASALGISSRTLSDALREERRNGNKAGARFWRSHWFVQGSRIIDLIHSQGSPDGPSWTGPIPPPADG